MPRSVKMRELAAYLHAVVAVVMTAAPGGELGELGELAWRAWLLGDLRYGVQRSDAAVTTTLAALPIWDVTPEICDVFRNRPWGARMSTGALGGVDRSTSPREYTQ